MALTILCRGECSIKIMFFHIMSTVTLSSSFFFFCTSLSGDGQKLPIGCGAKDYSNSVVVIVVWGCISGIFQFIRPWILS